MMMLLLLLLRLKQAVLLNMSTALERFRIHCSGLDLGMFTPR